MTTVFGTPKGLYRIDFKPAGTSITGEFYVNVIQQLRTAIKENQKAKLAAGALLLQDNKHGGRSCLAYFCCSIFHRRSLNPVLLFCFNIKQLLKIKFVEYYAMTKIDANE